ncbi:MAG: PAS domain S-box protein [Spirochaetia bacterium]|jgi:PAS domain S-box-containing protein
MDEVNSGGRSNAPPVSPGMSVLWIVSVALVYFAAARLSLSLLIKPEGIAAVWPPAGIFLSAVLLSRRNLRPVMVAVLFVTDMICEMLAGTPLLVSVIYAFALAGDAVVSSWLLLRFVGKQIGFTRVREVVGFVVLVVIVSNGLMSLVAAAASLLIPGASSFWNSWKWWAASDGMGNLIVTPFILGWASWVRTGRRLAWHPKRVLEGAALFVPLAALNLLAFEYMSESNVFPLFLPYLTFPFLLWAALRFGVRSVASASLAIMAIAIPFAGAGRITSFISWGSPLSGVLFVQLYLAIMAIPPLFLSAVVAERGRSADALRESEITFKSVFESANVGKSITLTTGEIRVNKAFCDLLGYAQAELEGKKWQDFTHPDDIDLTQRFVDQLQKGEEDSVRFTKRFIHKNGSWVWVDLSSAARRDKEGKPINLITTIIDITEQKRAEEELKNSEMQYRTLAENSPDLIARFDRQLRHLYVNSTAAKAGLRYATPEEYVGKTIIEAGVSEQEAKKWEERIRTVFETGQIVDVEDAFKTPNGLNYFNTKFIPEFAPDRSIHSVQSIARDITERKRAEAAQRKSEDKFSKAFRASPDVLVISRRDNGLIIETNDSWERLFGYSREEAIGSHSLEMGLFANPADRQRAVAQLQEHGFVRDFEIAIQQKSTAMRQVTLSIEPIEIDNEPCMLTIIHDITSQRLMEDQMRQAQKMETVGQLAGGVAHDFNNMLQVIISYVEISLAKVDPDQPLHKYLLQIRRAAHRSAEITGQLLAFARKQTASPKVLDLNEAVAGAKKMIQRLIEEDIELAWMPGRDLWKVKIDPAQLDQILANLAVNARDAIGGVGKLTIETDKAVLDEAYCATHAGSVPGEYVLLAVSDDGHGMDKETMSHLFEPFFTTKGVGQGTGLGLATVYGIVKQNSGFINVYSNPGQGTTFKVYLPRAEGAVEAGLVEAEPAFRGGTETVLVVEDEPAILEIARGMLEELGYTVLSARLPEEATRMSCEHGGPIQLLITDVVMPRMNGRQLAERLCSARPEMKRLFMSGYTADVIAHRGVLEEGVSFIAKPFSLTTLAEKVREVLDSSPGSAAQGGLTPW